MRQTDYDPFCKMLRTCLLMWGDAPAAEVSAMWFRILSDHDLSTVQAAFNGHMRDPVNGKFAPKPAHIIEQIQRAEKDDGRPGPEEAWALSLAAMDENDTVVWTRECAQAWGACRPVMNLGDEVGARMAFREAYTRLVADARSNRDPVAWEVSEGFDKDKRRIAVCSAVEAGRINAGHHLALPNEGHTLLLSASSAITKSIPPDVREKLKQLRDWYTAPALDVDHTAAEREKLAEKKRAMAARVAEYQRQNKDAA